MAIIPTNPTHLRTFLQRTLSPQEFRVLGLTTEGWDYRKIGDILGFKNPHLVYVHLHKVYAKLSLHRSTATPLAPIVTATALYRKAFPETHIAKELLQNDIRGA